MFDGKISFFATPSRASSGEPACSWVTERNTSLALRILSARALTTTTTTTTPATTTTTTTTTTTGYYRLLSSTHMICQGASRVAGAIWLDDSLALQVLQRLVNRPMFLSFQGQVDAFPSPQSWGANLDQDICFSQTGAIRLELGSWARSPLACLAKQWLAWKASLTLKDATWTPRERLHTRILGTCPVTALGRHVAKDPESHADDWDYWSSGLAS